jgi:hypothetical protein
VLGVVGLLIGTKTCMGAVVLALGPMAPMLENSEQMPGQKPESTIPASLRTRGIPDLRLRMEDLVRCSQQ